MRPQTSSPHRKRQAIILSILLLPAIIIVAAWPPDPPPVGPPGPPPWDSERAQELAQELSAYIRLRSDHPEGRTVETVEFLEDRYQEWGLWTRQLTYQEGKPNLLARLPATRPDGRGAVLLLHHMDVVPAPPQGWTHPPFEGAIADGAVWGRGALDMKGVGIMQGAAVRELLCDGAPRGRDVLLLAVCDEEAGGGQGAAAALARNGPALVCDLVLDEGGLGSLGLVDPRRPVFSIAVTERRDLWVEISALGPTGHGSRPLPDAAIEKLERALSAVRALASERPPRLVPALAAFLEGIAPLRTGAARWLLPHARRGFLQGTIAAELAGQPELAPLVSDTIAVTSLRAAVGDPPKVNVIPGEAKATLDIRLLPGTDAEDFYRRVEAAARGAGASASRLSQPAGSFETSAAHPALALAREAITRHIPEAIVLPGLCPGVTDSRHFRARGVAALGIVPVVLARDELGLFHATDERLRVDELARGAQIYADLLRRLVE